MVSSSLFFLTTTLVTLAASPTDSPQGRLATFDTSAGEIAFALSLLPNVQVAGEQTTRIVAVFDTSASQTGRYRDDGLSVLKSMLVNMDEGCRVNLIAADIRAISLTSGFVKPTGAEMVQAMAKLERRTPLGSTDMNAALRAALACFADGTNARRSIVFIGDGLSRANVLQADEFRELTADLVKNRVSVSSYAIGPERDVHLLAALANHTGGMVLVDTDESEDSDRAGTALGGVAQGTVIWPVSVKLPDAMQEVYPSPTPPFRTDRDTILIGILDNRNPQRISITAEVAGKQIDLAWNLTPESSNDEFGFLPQLIAETRDDDGLTLPTVGSAGLRQAGRVILAGAENLLKIGVNALKTGDLQGAQKIADSVLERDPTNPRALALKRAIEKKKAGGEIDDTPLIIKLR